ncbi:zinc finger CCCH-type with G patch domain-containing protein [Lingula anatina]|uniref:Zinc finger CCCH-type with G patch domain-containing protein n=1 Tax=Lingula anatina TaxID=7574 RepID=A0A1S3JK07_LINAN|nr:zinc finger CCCH-type with G patch domain-containing protein [Lingula anatina]|eukprot:XP_013410712.1 zinc finger CCCH-type with G patch domain-containing protein [Lingula anatina]
MDEESLKASIETYKMQLSQVECALLAAGADGSPDLVQLKSDLTELIQLTEASLLSLKKSQLLSMVEETTSSSINEETDTSNSQEPGQTDFDAEFAAFQAAVSDTRSENIPNIDQASCSENSTSVYAENQSVQSQDIASCSQYHEDHEQFHSDLTDQLNSELSGMKCRAPYAFDWGGMEYHNAMVVCVEPLDGEDEPKVRVLYCNPTHQSMLPCRYFLDGDCRFSEDDCRYSHGSVVSVSDLREFKEPDYSLLKEGSVCLAKYSDNIWYRAVVLSCKEDHKYAIKFKSYNEEDVVDLEDLIPLDNSDDPCDSDSDSDSIQPLKPLNDENSDEEEAVPVFLWKPPQTTQAMGEWEAYTKGIGSKLMLKMGYVMGEGLGKNGEGRAEPVPIKLLPPGKSLDKIMELQEKAGDQSLFDVMKKERKKQKKIEEKLKTDYKKEAAPNVFDFINKKLGGKKGDIHSLLPSQRHGSRTSKDSSKKTHINEKDLHQKSDQGMRVQQFKTDEEIRSVERQLSKLRDSHARNAGKEKKVADQIQQKISTMESYLSKLKSSAKTLSTHQKRRHDHKKLTIF